MPSRRAPVSHKAARRYTRQHHGIDQSAAPAVTLVARAPAPPVVAAAKPRLRVPADMPLIYRNAGVWGAGKGARLTSLEADGNVYDLDVRVQSLELNPPLAIGIDHFTVAGNALTIYLTDGSSHGPFTLPSAQWRWAGEWQPLTQFYALDLIGYAGSIYLVRHPHVSAAVFAADAEDVEGFRYVRLIAPADQPYDVGMYHPATIPDDGSVLLQHVATRPFVLPLGFAESTAYLGAPVSTENIALSIFKNADVIGTIEFNIDEGLIADEGGQLGTFVGATPAPQVQFLRTDRLSIKAPDLSDDTAAGLSVTFAGRAGTI